jgi:hypothetical protein
MTTRNIFGHGQLRCALWVAFLATLAGCVVEPVGGRAYVASPVVQVAQPIGIDGGLIYYPNYEMYFDPGARLYWYNRGGAWITGPSPYGVSVDVLIGSPSVRMDFRDSPANHHGEVIRRYPRNWRPAGRDERGR